MNPQKENTIAWKRVIKQHERQNRYVTHNRDLGKILTAENRMVPLTAYEHLYLTHKCKILIREFLRRC